MSTDTDASDDRMKKINVRVPENLLNQVDEEWERVGTPANLRLFVTRYVTG